MTNVRPMAQGVVLMDHNSDASDLENLQMILKALGATNSVERSSEYKTNNSFNRIIEVVGRNGASYAI